MNTLSEDLKELSENIQTLADLKISQLRKTLPTVEQDIAELEAAKLIPKPKHLTNEQWANWIEGTNQMIENFKKIK